MKKVIFLMLMGLALAVVALPGGVNLAYAGPGGGTYYANSPAGSGSGTPLRKFVNDLPGVGSANPNNLGQFMPVAVKDTTTYPGSDFYHIGIVEYTEKMHSDLPKLTKLRGYRDLGGAQAAHYLGPIIIAQRDRPVRLLIDNLLPTGANGKLFIPVDTTLMGAGTGPNLGPELFTQNRTSTHLHGGVTPWISDGTPHQWMTPAGETTSYVKGVSFQNVPDMTKTPTPNGSQTLYWTNQQSARLMFYHEHALGITRLGVYAGLAAGYLITDAQEDDLIARGIIPGSSFPAAKNYGHGIPLIIQDKTFVPQNIAVQDALWTNSTSTPTGVWGDPGDLWFPNVYEINQNPADPTGANPFGRWDYGPWFWPPVITVKGPIPTPSTTPEAFMDTPVVNGTAYPFLPVDRKAYRFRILNACNDRMLNLQLYYSDVDPGPGGTVATATATVLGGAVTGFTITNPGSQYASVPGVHLVGGGGFGATAVATLTNGFVTGITVTYGGTGYGSAPTVTIGGGTEVKMVPAIPTNGFPAAWPTDGRDGGVPDPNRAGPQMIQIGTEGGFLPQAVQLPNQPVNYEYNKRNIVVLNVKEKTLFMGPAERADVIVDFSQCPAGSKVILYNDAPAPVPAMDPRLDYYTGGPDQTANGGAPPTAAGVGPNTRTIMQFQVSNSTPDLAFSLTNLQNTATGLPAAYVASQPPPIVPEAAYGPTYGTTFPDTFSTIQANSLTFTPMGGLGAKTVNFNSKAIQELWDPYGRMNATLGVELPLTNILTQTTLPFGYVDPITEIIRFGETQLWKISHNGVDTHAIHFHLFNVQLINRVGWDGAITPPDANELGWKETVRMNPLEDVIVALRPERPYFPFGVPDSIRPLDPSSPLGSTGQFATFDPQGNPVTTYNTLYNFGWEYVWHCHLLGHEENDMMRPIKLTGNAIPQVTDYLLLLQ